MHNWLNISTRRERCGSSTSETLDAEWFCSTTSRITTRLNLDSMHTEMGSVSPETRSISMSGLHDNHQEFLRDTLMRSITDARKQMISIMGFPHCCYAVLSLEVGKRLGTGIEILRGPHMLPRVRDAGNSNPTEQIRYGSLEDSERLSRDKDDNTQDGSLQKILTRLEYLTDPPCYWNGTVPGSTAGCLTKAWPSHNQRRGQI